MPAVASSKGMQPTEMHVGRDFAKAQPTGAATGFWIDGTMNRLPAPENALKQTWWWLPPVVWPGQEVKIKRWLTVS
jgi:hypothetical protein